MSLTPRANWLASMNPPAEPAHRKMIVHEVGGWKGVALSLFAGVVRLWCRTLRFVASKEELAMIQDTSKPTAVVLWHNRIFVAGELRRRLRNGRVMCGLVSASRDGAWLAGFFRRLGIQTVRGSSSRRALAAAREMLKRLQNGSDVAITPDGPRGPIYRFHDGATLLALASGAPVLLLAPNFSCAWRLKSWDGFYLPYPFSKVTLRARHIEHDELPRDRDECTQFLRQALLDLTVDGQAGPVRSED